jgi:hypothetical protein
MSFFLHKDRGQVLVVNRDEEEASPPSYPLGVRLGGYEHRARGPRTDFRSTVRPRAEGQTRVDSQMTSHDTVWIVDSTHRLVAVRERLRRTKPKPRASSGER